MYMLCSCHELLYRHTARGGVSIGKIKHFQQNGHQIVGKYTYIKDVPEPYFSVHMGKNFGVNR